VQDKDNPCPDAKTKALHHPLTCGFCLSHRVQDTSGVRSEATARHPFH
jgi:hypothetical protein